jgi:hypothetical protein
MKRNPWFIVAAAGLLLACTFPSGDARDMPSALPDEATFAPVAELLSVRCGSLDCHGSLYRNLRVYGSTGMRYSPADRPFAPLCNTCDENEQTYQSVVGLEPEKMSQVVSGAADPASLTMVEKSRGAEAHKGGQIWSAGDPSDTCLTSWLKGSVDSADCESGVESALLLANPTGDSLLTCFDHACTPP